MKDWDPNLYLKFSDYRTQPSIDLVSRIGTLEPRDIIDLGCGAGNSTSVIQGRWPSSKVTGIDSSEAMVQAAKRNIDSVTWIVSKIEDWIPDQELDLVYSNAALQWVSGHQVIFPRLVGFLAKGGILAVQMPFHYKDPIHQVMVEVSRYPKWSRLLEAARVSLEWHESDYYYDLLVDLCDEISIWETSYWHIMDGPEDILEWVSGTGLRPFLEGLSSAEAKVEFRAEVLKGYQGAYPRRADGKSLFSFKRQFLVARKR